MSAALISEESHELRLILRAKQDHAATHVSELAFSAGDILIYFPQRPSSHGLGVGAIGEKEGFFRIGSTEVYSASAAEAPPATPLPMAGARPPERNRGKEDWWPQAHSFRVALSLVLNEPESCVLARLVSGWVVGLILLSTLAFVLESLPEVHIDGGPQLHSPEAWEQLETLIVMQFSIEYALRLSTCERVLPFVIDPMNLIDLAAIAPWYIELLGFGVNSSVLRIFRLVRVVRVLKLGKYAPGLQLFGRTLLSSVDALVLLFFFLAIATVLASSVMYFLERGEWSTERQEWLTQEGDVSQFSSIPATFWWCVVTLTTVGYGDVVPTTLQGRFVAVLTMLAGILTIALPVSILGSNFQLEFEKLKKERRRKEAQVHAARTRSSSDLISPLQQELIKLGELFSEMDALSRAAQEKQAALMHIANSPLFREHAFQTH